MTQITETALRDAHQSLFATRLRLGDAMEAAPLLDLVGFASLEAWGGATFDSCLRFLGEDPWLRLRALKAVCPRTPIQMLLRGQNLVGYRHYADDVVDKFVELSARNGVDIFRIFDALNDVRNMERAIDAVKRVGKHAQGTLSYTTSPFHTIELYIEQAKTLAQMGCDSLCIKDMAGIILPKDAFQLVSSLKRAVNLPIVLHSHCTAGLAPMSYQAAIGAGVDRLDCAISPFAGGTSQPATESVAHALHGTEQDAGLDLVALGHATEMWKDIRAKYEPLIDRISERIDARALTYQVPGGMLSNLVSQLKTQKKMDKFEEVLAEVPKVRAEMGYPPLVTPTSQIVGVQAVFNVLLGRYKVVGNETKALVKGMYGRTPAPIDPEFSAKILGNEQPIQGRPADCLEPELDKLQAEYGKTGLIKKPEDLLTLAMNPTVGKDFLSGKVKAEKAPWE
jgi:pyruvate carboxylase subunit B